MIQAALPSYESSRATGVGFGNVDFQSCVKRQVQAGEFFRAYPTCFPHINTAAMMTVLGRTDPALEVIHTEGRGCRFGIRAKIFPYPNGIVAVWVMIGVCAESS